MLLGLCASVEKLQLAKDLGFDFLEENVQNFLVPLKDDEAFSANSAKAWETDLPVAAANCFLPGNLKSTGPAADISKIAAYAETAFRRAHDINLEVIVFGSGGSRQIPAGFEREEARKQFVELLKELGALAEGLGVHLVVEPLNRAECNFINSLAEGAEIVAAVNHPHVRLLADFYHMLRDGEDPQEIVRHGRYLRHLHLAEKAERTAPGAKGDDFKPFLKAAQEIGYDARLSWECKWGDLDAEGKGSLAYIRRQMEEAGEEE